LKSIPDSPFLKTVMKPETDLFRIVEFPSETKGTEKVNVEFRNELNQLFKKHRPSRHPFFRNLKNASPSVVKNPEWLSEFYLRYQSAMHCTRAMVYFVPNLNSPTLRQRKLAILEDDDALTEDSHHKYLENLFRYFGIEPIDQEFFGDLDILIPHLDPRTTTFVREVIRLYPLSTGAWCLAEVLSDDWLSALADAFSAFFQNTFTQDYFDEIFTGKVEIRHMLETVSLTENVMQRYPETVTATIQHMKDMAENMDGLWDNLNSLVVNPEPFLKSKSKS